MLDDFGIVGTSWRQAGSAALARYALPAETLGDGLSAFRRRWELAEIAYLNTCNRVEVIYARTAQTPPGDLRPAIFELLAGTPPEPGQAARTLTAWQGEGACEHLFLVAAGLDSAALGEAEIAGQVRASLDQSKALGLSGSRLALLFQEALRVAATVRDSTRLGEGSVSLAEVAVAHIHERLQGATGARRPVALIGVSAMTERAAASLAKAGAPLLIVNRTRSRAGELAQRFDAACLSLDEFKAAPPPVAAVLAATGAGEAVVDRQALERLIAHDAQRPLCVDLAVPADIDPAACAALGIRRISLDDIVAEAESNREARLAEAAQARQLVDAALPQLRQRLAERHYGPLFSAVQQHYLDAAESSAKRLVKDLGDLDDAQRRTVRIWTQAQARRFAHLPTVGIRGLLQHGPEGSVEAFIKGLNPDVAKVLQQALSANGGSEA